MPRVAISESDSDLLKIEASWGLFSPIFVLHVSIGNRLSPVSSSVLPSEDSHCQDRYSRQWQLQLAWFWISSSVSSRDVLPNGFQGERGGRVWPSLPRMNRSRDSSSRDMDFSSAFPGLMVIKDSVVNVQAAACKSRAINPIRISRITDFEIPTIMAPSQSAATLGCLFPKSATSFVDSSLSIKGSIIAKQGSNHATRLHSTLTLKKVLHRSDRIPNVLQLNVM